MRKVYMIHGYGGEPNGGWRPWLMGELAQKDVWACALAMPMADGPKKDDWVKEINRAMGAPSEDVFLIGHSLGVCAILRYLETLKEGEKIGGAVLVSGPIHALEPEKYKSILHFMDYPFNFDHIKKVCKNFAVIHGDDDPAVPFEQGKELSGILGCKLMVVPNGKHLSGSTGHTKLPEALNALEEMIK